MTVIEEYLTAVNGLTAGRSIPPGFVYRSAEVFIAANGRAFEVSLNQTLPGAVAIWPQQCYANAYRMAKRWPRRFRYVEGIAVGVIPVSHAWCINDADEVVDPTWNRYTDKGVGSEYFGVVFPLAVVRQVRHADNLSMLNNWQRDYPLFRESWPGVLERGCLDLPPAKRTR